METFDLNGIAVCLSAILLFAYFLFLAYGIRRNPDFTIHAVNDKARIRWVHSVMQDRTRDIMAVQTLRNFMMAATFNASSAILLIIGTLTLSGQAESLAKTWHVLNLGDVVPREWWIIKIMALLTTLIVAFFSFALCVRLLNHVVFMINLPSHEALGVLAPEQVAKRLNQAGRFYRAGMRAYFVTVPLVFWLFGPVFLLISMVCLIVALYFLDRSPLI